MRVIVQLQEDAAMELQQGQVDRTSSSTKELLDAAAGLGARLEPLHPGQTHPLLTPYFMVEVADREAAQKVIDSLSRFPIVEAAYLKPEEELP
ncbi:MAG: hypothetical protein AABM67_00005 [Acidobacteriota bacterium]